MPAPSGVLVWPWTAATDLGAVDRRATALMVVLAMLSMPLSIASLQRRLDVLALLGQPSWPHALDTGQLQAEVMLQLSVHDDALLIAQIFRGLWLMPFGWLVEHSGQLPAHWATC